MPSILDARRPARHRRASATMPSSTAVARWPRPRRPAIASAILDLTRGEMGTRGSAEIRAAGGSEARPRCSASRCARISGCPTRTSSTTGDAREARARAFVGFRPRVVIAPALEGRHPDHRVAAQLVRDAWFLAGLAKFAPDVGEAPAAQDPALPRVSAGFHSPEFRRRHLGGIRAEARGDPLLRVAVRGRDAGGRSVPERRAARGRRPPSRAPITVRSFAAGTASRSSRRR